MVSVGVSNIKLIITRERRTEWEAIIYELYFQEGDEFFRHHHKCGGDMMECVYDMLETISRHAEFYSVRIDSGLLGFFVKTECEGQYVLEGFHIMRGFRIAPIIKEFWALVKETFAQPFYIGIFEGNTPALNHLKKNGFEELGSTENQGKRFILLHNKLI